MWVVLGLCHPDPVVNLPFSLSPSLHSHFCARWVVTPLHIQGHNSYGDHHEPALVKQKAEPLEVAQVYPVDIGGL